MVDWQSFDCQTCARGPHLQDIQGCFTPSPRPFLKLLEYEFYRCPVRYQTKNAHKLTAYAREGILEGLSFREKMSMPAKRLAALQYLTTLLKVRDDDRT